MRIRFHSPKPDTIRFYFGMTDTACLASDKGTIERTMEILRSSTQVDPHNLPIATGSKFVSWTGWYINANESCPIESETVSCTKDPRE